MRNSITRLVIVVLIGVTISACNIHIPKPTPTIILANTTIPMDKQNRYVGLEELYKSAPINSTDQNDWEQWVNKYEGMHVKGKGRFDAISMHPQEGKLFLIVTVFEKEGILDTDTTQIAFLVEEANTISLGEEEGSFLVNDLKWIYLGDVYTFDGTLSIFSRFDTELVSSGYGDLIIIMGKLQDIKKEIIAENSSGTSNGAGDDGVVTPTADISEAKNLPSTLIAFYSPQLSETSVSPIWDISQISCDEKPIYMWSLPGIYLYKVTNESGENYSITVERISLIKDPGEDQCRMPWPNFGDRLLEPQENGFQTDEHYDFCDYDHSRPPGQISIIVEGNENKSVEFGTYQAVKVNTLQNYHFYLPPNYPQGNFTTSEWYACGLGLIYSSTSHVGKYQQRDFELEYGLELISFTPIFTNESHVRFILIDIQLGNLAEQYRVNITDEETAEALRRWDAGIRVENKEIFERKIINGQWRIVFLGSENPVSGDAVNLTSE